MNLLIALWSFGALFTIGLFIGATAKCKMKNSFFDHIALVVSAVFVWPAMLGFLYGFEQTVPDEKEVTEP